MTWASYHIFPKSYYLLLGIYRPLLMSALFVHMQILLIYELWIK